MSVVLDVIYKDDIPIAVKNILESEHDESIIKVTCDLCKWLSSGCAADNLNLWIIAILEGLCNAKRFNALMTISESVIISLSKSLRIPVTREKVFQIFVLILSSTLHTDKIFNIVS